VRNRVGFSLVETLVALALFQFVMLALAAGAAVAARDLAAARRTALAHSMARNRVARLASTPCPPPGIGTLEANRFIEHWRVDRAANRRLIIDSVTFARPNGSVGFVVARGVTLCIQ
jgi:Tfp pilus assembly protein PilV